MISHHKEERENDMKNRLIIALAICVMSLSACSTVQGTAPATSSSVSHASVKTQADCSSLHKQQAQLQKVIDAASMQLSSAYGDLQKAEHARNTLTRLHEPSLLLQAKLSACPAAG
jgi:peptidoglycan hydrolase CwlO-like protein